MRMGPNPMTGVLIQEEGTWTQKEDSHLKKEAESGVVWPHTEELRDYQKMDRARERPLLESSEGE